MKEALRWASMISGSGTTMVAIGMACQKGGLLHGLVIPTLVISTREGVEGIDRAKKLGIPVEVLPRKQFSKDKEGIQEYGKAILKILHRFSPDVVTLNGCLAQISPEVTTEYVIYNQHPGPRELGGRGMYGRRVHAAAIIFNRLLKRNPPWTEVIAQHVDPKYDRGAVVQSARVNILPIDTVDSLQKRALPLEHQVQLNLLVDVVHNRVTEVNRGEAFVHPMNPWEYVVLYVAKEAGKALYPQG